MTAWLTTAAIAVALATPAANAAEIAPLDASASAPPGGGHHPPSEPGSGRWPGRPPHPGGGNGWPGEGHPHPGGGEHHPGGGDHPYPGDGPWRDPVERHPVEPPADDSPAPSNGSTATCRPDEGSCTVTPAAGPDSRFRITATGGKRTTELFGTLNGGSRPSCPDYRAHNSDWVQFGFRDGASGSSWDKTVSLTTRHARSKADAAALADSMHICFEAPYPFATRDGYRLGQHGDTYDGVLPECGRAADTAVANPCVTEVETIPADDGWVVRFTFRVPANALDPKALG